MRWIVSSEQCSSEFLEMTVCRKSSSALTSSINGRFYSILACTTDKGSGPLAKPENSTKFSRAWWEDKLRRTLRYKAVDQKP
ncbi:hypothetical protein KC19_4G207000 [Ceratodon purpureus]|uniref:Uncharacterized protein n=1 Tax=Ceratodon purpureus TaxID=3225 RepID=A0A8T0ID91_CERPU|nr:hypothetical protein KC19_4G207000 [Ceratodon purpureus]